MEKVMGGREQIRVVEGTARYTSRLKRVSAPLGSLSHGAKQKLVVSLS